MPYWVLHNELLLILWVHHVQILSELWHFHQLRWQFRVSRSCDLFFFNQLLLKYLYNSRFYRAHPSCRGATVILRGLSILDQSFGGVMSFSISNIPNFSSRSTIIDHAQSRSGSTSHLPSCDPPQGPFSSPFAHCVRGQMPANVPTMHSPHCWHFSLNSDGPPPMCPIELVEGYMGFRRPNSPYITNSRTTWSPSPQAIIRIASHSSMDCL